MYIYRLSGSMLFLVTACASASPRTGALTHQDTSAIGASDDGVDGTPTRQACTGDFGSGLSADHGRLDGYLVSVIAPGTDKSCNGDKSHVHLQIQMQGDIYDVAVNADGGYIATMDVPLPGGAWSEGWNTSAPLDYVDTLGVHTSDFTQAPLDEIAQDIQQAVANANHIAIFATGYDESGIHDVHRESANRDGAIAINPLSDNAHLLLFHFSDQDF